MRSDVPSTCRPDNKDFARFFRNDYQQVYGKRSFAQGGPEGAVAIDSIWVYSEREGYRFGSIAYSRGHVTLEQIQQALAEQVEDNVTGRQHRYLSTILKEKRWITAEQEESILAEMFADGQHP
jgi:hypothetical protein